MNLGIFCLISFLCITQIILLMILSEKMKVKHKLIALKRVFFRKLDIIVLNLFLAMIVFYKKSKRPLITYRGRLLLMFAFLFLLNSCFTIPETMSFPPIMM